MLPAPPHKDLLKYCENDREELIITTYLEVGTAAATSAIVELDSSTVTKIKKKIEARARDDGWAPDDPLKVDERVVNKNVKKVRAALKASVSTYVVTWAQNATPVHDGFWAALQQYKEHTGAKLIVLPGRYKNPTSTWSQSQDNSEYWCDEVADYLMNKRVTLGKNFMVMGDIKTQPTATAPLSGFETITEGASAIFGHPKIQLKAIATPQNELPKLQVTSGACTIPNYTDSKAGAKGEFHHIIGAAVVDIESDGTFHLRQINATEDGSFTDLEYDYHPESVRKAARPSFLVLGDVHSDMMDPVVEKVTFHDKDCMLDTLNPEQLIIHDWYDGFSGSHHHKRKPFTKFAKHHAGRHNVKQEVDRTIEKAVSWLRDDIQFVMVDSNHNDHLLQWLEEGEPRNDPENAIFYHEMCAAVLKKTHFSDNKLYVPNPLQILVESKGIENFRFLEPHEPYIVNGIDLSNHGHLGFNGSRGSIMQYNKMGVKTVSGHSHTPGIEGGAYACGTNSILEMEYVRGPSSWMHTDCIGYANGKRTLVNIINGRWRARRRLKRSMVK
jgi:hypothetical protein